MKIISPVCLAIAGAIMLLCQAANAQGSKQADFRYEFANVAEKVIPAIVSIQTEISSKSQNSRDDFNQFFGVPKQRGGKQQGQGSGVIVSQAGQVLTNNHVIEDASQITVMLSDKREFKAKIVGADKQTDIAVLQLEGDVKKLPVAKLGNSDALRVGEWVIAVGNPFGLSQTVTKGIVSAKGVHNTGITNYESFIQTDAAINPGNSGGGLFNLSGDLIGINTAILSRSGGFQGIGFAIPVNQAKSVMDDLLSGGKVSRGWLGANIQEIDQNLAKALKLSSAKGAFIGDVVENSPAEKGGLKASDVVRFVNEKAIENANDLRNMVAMLRPGEVADFEVLRDGKTLKLKVTIALKEEKKEKGQKAK